MENVYIFITAEKIGGGMTSLLVSKDEMEMAEGPEDFFVHGTVSNIISRGEFTLEGVNEKAHMNSHLLPGVFKEMMD